METRLVMEKVEPEAYKAMFAMEKYLRTTDIAPLHKELIKIRASQINGCAYCIDMHTKDARKLGETEQRIYALNAWRETPFFSQEERAILALTEEVTLISHHVSDATYNTAIQVLGEKLTAQVMMAAVAINSWNRIGIATRMMPV
ncbi:carboxymuconolactone decarboxylase family protein [Chitinophaga filiformis]|uniref:Alkylhydroperoxidase AhpD family core domain-containing protein n=1 Tax=Chitinophaga filiformis TaxID=104663 RepID=A0A1G7QZW6_CHIFI|nr:carboxymuconolactone decarboxylase family protein [Chitinophaga filiformis]SDG04027.1 alkylhydroperoxidase AhpD family core domain-containing protein [Chitinophaga filiformis]